MPKNIVVCCDGTGNEIDTRTTNVLKLFRCLQRGPEQVVFYDPGVGTIATETGWNRFKQKVSSVFGLATGWGIDERVLRAYQFISRHYCEGDRIYIFGFSRGAYTARVTAALIHGIGLLNPDQSNLASYGLRLYREVARKAGTRQFERLGHFQRFAGGRRVSIDFLGVWDTVSTLIEPRTGWFLLPWLAKLPFTRTNEKVRVFRQAMAIDERRRMYRLNAWTPVQKALLSFDPIAGPSFTDQDIRQIWFAGNHSDIGGGHPEPEAGLAKFSLQWMVDEAMGHELKVDPGTFDHMMGKAGGTANRHTYSPPSADAKLHSRLAFLWHVIEWLPKLSCLREWRGRWAFLGFYIPRYEPRPIADDALIHESVERRVKNPANRYDPVNLPPKPNFVAK